MNKTFRKVGGVAAIAAATWVGLWSGQQARAEDKAVTATAEALPSAKSILEKYIEVTGGRAAYEKITSRETTGKMSIPAQNVTAVMTMKQAGGEKFFNSINFQGLGEMKQGSDGQTVWESNAMTGTRILTGDEKEERLRDTRLDGEANWEKYFSSAETVAEEVVDGRPAYKVKMVSSSNGAVTHRLYDKETGLMVGMELTTKSPMGELAVKTKISDYKDFDGLKIPTSTVSEVAGTQMVLTIDSVKHNTPIDDTAFALPPEVQQLKGQTGETKK